jgi:hypothetical protein
MRLALKLSLRQDSIRLPTKRLSGDGGMPMTEAGVAR